MPNGSAGEQAIRGFTTGLTGGLKLGIALEEQQAKVKARLTEIQEEKFSKGFKLSKAASEFQASGTRAGRQRAFQLANQAAEAFGLPPSDEPFDDTKDFSEVFKEAQGAIKAFEGKTVAGGNRELLMESLNDSYNMARDILTPAEQKELKVGVKEELGGAEERREQALLGQVARLPQFEQAGIITPEQAAEARITGLGEAGALKAPAAPREPGREKARTETFISPIDKKSHVFQFNTESGKFDIDLGLAARTTSEEFAVTQARTRILDKFNAEPAIRRAESMISSATTIIDAVESNNPVANAALPTLMARASGEVGNLSEADKAPFGGSRALVARMKQVGEELSTGLRTEENLKFIRELAVIFSKTGEKTKNRLAKQRAKQFARVSRGVLEEDEILGFLAPLSEETPSELDAINKELADIEKELGEAK